MIGGKVVVVTGASSGIGRATALLFAKHGANLVLTYRKNKEGAKEVEDEIKEYNVRCLTLCADVTNEADVTRLFKSALAEFGNVDILINNAGFSAGAPFTTSSLQQWIDIFMGNFFGAVLCAQKAAQIMMTNQSGKILNTSSIRGLNHAGREGIMAYSAAKAALNNFTLTLAKELAPYVQVNAIAPGFVRTPYYDTIDSTLREQFVQGALIERFIEVEEIAEGFLFLAQASSVTGEILVMDGGYTLIKG